MKKLLFWAALGMGLMLMLGQSSAAAGCRSILGCLFGPCEAGGCGPVAPGPAGGPCEGPCAGPCGPGAGPCGAAGCDPCCDPCGGPGCGPPCGPLTCLFNLLGIGRGYCGEVCGERAWGDRPDCQDPCDYCGNWIGRGNAPGCAGGVCATEPYGPKPVMARRNYAGPSGVPIATSPARGVRMASTSAPSRQVARPMPNAYAR